MIDTAQFKHAKTDPVNICVLTCFFGVISVTVNE